MGGIVFADKTILHQIFGAAVPSSAAPRYVSLKDAEAVELVITGKNGSTVTGSAVTLSQAQDVSGTNAKALAFTVYSSVIDPVNTSVVANATAASNTFTTLTTNSAEFVYRIPVDPSTLDLANNFKTLSVGLANAVNSTISAYVQVKPKYSGNRTSMPNITAN